jgi:hypothetical protein
MRSPWFSATRVTRDRSRAYHDKLVEMILTEEAKLIGHLAVVHDPRTRLRKSKDTLWTISTVT